MAKHEQLVRIYSAHGDAAMNPSCAWAMAADASHSLPSASRELAAQSALLPVSAVEAAASTGHLDRQWRGKTGQLKGLASPVALFSLASVAVRRGS